MLTYQDLNKIEGRNVPHYLEEFMNVKEFLRLKGVGMSCGLEYTSFPFFENLVPYSRFYHSLGVALLLSRFTSDKRVILSGLYHDIATPCFAHVIDFLNHDYEKQESTEEKTYQIIHGSREIQILLEKYGLREEEICNYHLYSLADNDTPRLSADRLEYHLGNSFQYGFLSLPEISSILDDLRVTDNENGEQEIAFSSLALARKFTDCALSDCLVYSSKDDRYAMESLALLLRDCLDKGVIQETDFYLDESSLIDKIRKEEDSGKRFLRFCSLSDVKSSSTEKEGYFRVRAKKRYVDPLVIGRGRILDLDPVLKKKADSILDQDFLEYLCGNDREEYFR